MTTPSLPMTFTLAFDVLLRGLGHVRALVYGRVWRFSQMESGACSASAARIANDLGMCARSVQRCIKWLCANGYLIDQTPDIRGRAHILLPTNKAEEGAAQLKPERARTAAGHVPARLGPPLDVERSPIPEAVPGELATQSLAFLTVDPPAVTRSRTGTTPSRTPATASPIKKQRKIPPNRQKNRLGDARRRATDIPAVMLFRQVTRRFPPAANFTLVEKSLRLLAERLGRDATAEDLQAFYAAWTARGYNPASLGWLEWVRAGERPRHARHGARSAEIPWPIPSKHCAVADRNDLIDVLKLLRHLPKCPLNGDAAHDESVLQSYLEVLKQFDARELVIASKHCLATGTFFPTPRDLREAVFELERMARGEPSPSEAWAMVLRAVRHVSAYWCEEGAALREAGIAARGPAYAPAFWAYDAHMRKCTICWMGGEREHYEHPIVERFVRALGGRKAILTSHDQSDRSRFVDAYRDWMARSRLEAETMPGVREYVQVRRQELQQLAGD